MTPKASSDDVRVLLDERADPVDRARAVALVASDSRYDLEGALSDLLDSAEPALRGEAILALVGRWHKPAYLGDALRLLRSDRTWHVRADAATALAWFAREQASETNRSAALLGLARCVAEDRDATVQRRCYAELLGLTGTTAEDLPDDFDRNRDVDWARVRPYLAP